MPLIQLLLRGDAVVLPPDEDEEALASMTFTAPADHDVSSIEITPVSMMIVDVDGDVIALVSLSASPMSFNVPMQSLTKGQMVVITGQINLD